MRTTVEVLVCDRCGDTQTPPRDPLDPSFGGPRAFSLSVRNANGSRALHLCAQCHAAVMQFATGEYTMTSAALDSLARAAKLRLAHEKIASLESALANSPLADVPALRKENAEQLAMFASFVKVVRWYLQEAGFIFSDRPKRALERLKVEVEAAERAK